jgi:hypothetical protein
VTPATAAVLMLAAGFAAGAAEPLPYAAFAQPLRHERVALSSDGEYLATDTLVDGKRSLLLMRLSDRHRVEITPRERDEIVGFEWVDTRRLFYTVGTRAAGTGRPVPTGKLFFVDADGSNGALLFGARAAARRRRSSSASRRG